MVSWSLLLISLALFKGPGNAARTPLRRTLSEAASPSGSLSTSEATPTKDQDGKDFQRHQCTGSCELVSRGSNNNTKTSCQCVSPANSNSFVNIEFDHQLRKIYLKCSEEFVIISELESFGLILKNASGYQVTLTKFCCPTNLGGSGNLGRVLGRGLGLTALGGLRVRPRHFQLDLNPGSFRGLQALRIRNLNLQGNITGIAGPNIFLPFKDTLRNLRIENTRTRRLPSDLFAGLENLRALFVIRNHNLLYGAFRGSQFKGLARLEELALRDNNQTHLDQSIFRSMEGLTKLDLGANRFLKLPNDTFDQLTGLEELSILEDCNTQYINAPRCERFFSSRHFQPLKQLKRFSYSAYNHYLCPHFDQNTFEYQNDIHYIRITNACLRSHHLSNFGALPNLKELDVSQNNLTNLGNFEPAHSNIILNLNNNRLDCTCENVNFLIKYGIEPTQQIMPCNMDASFQMDCEQESSLLYVTLASSVAVLAMVLVACFVYTNHRQLQKTKATNSFDDSGEYSAFLSYCNEDKEFAHEIKDSMENNIGSGFKFLYHEEHFGLGRPIIDNIDRAVEVSRCVLLILSQNYARSNRCHDELVSAMRQNKEIFAILTKGTEVQDLDIDNCGTEDEFEAKLSDNDEDHNTIEHINGDGSLIMGNRGIPKRRIIFKYAKMNTCLKQENDKFWEKLEKKLTEYKIEPKENNADLSKSAYNKSCFPHKFNLKQLKVKDTQNKEDDSL